MPSQSAVPSPSSPLPPRPNRPGRQARPRRSRRSRRRLWAGAAGLLLAAAALPLVPAVSDGGPGAAQAEPRDGAAAAADCPWVGSRAPVADRVAQLMAAMSAADEIALTHGSQGPYVGDIAAQPSLCIPALTFQDGPAGVGDGMTGVTQLPAPVAEAATWDSGLAQQYGAVVGAEDAGKGVDVSLGPTVNLVRDPRWGRAFESFGEDPYLNGQLGAADVRGVQSQGVMAQVKHVAVYNQETARNTPQDDAVIDPRTEQELYLPAFAAAVQQGGAASAMCSYSTIDGVPACADAPLLDGVMRGQFGFTGFTTSDWTAVRSGAAAAANGGLDVDMPGDVPSSPTDAAFGPQLAAAVADGQVSRATLDAMVRPVLTQMFAYGLFDRPASGSPTATVTSAAHTALAREVATDGAVLLKNDDGQLPLDPTQGQRIAVIGDDAAAGALTGGGGSARVKPTDPVSPVQGIAAALTPAHPEQVAASGYAAASPGVRTEPTADAQTLPVGHGLDVGWLGNGAWLEYAGVDFGATASGGGSSGGAALEVQARMASALGGQPGTVAFHLDSPTAPAFAELTVVPTGGWQQWQTSLPVTADPRPSGVHGVYLTFSSPQPQNFVNLDWLSFGAGSGVSAAWSQGATTGGTLTAVPVADLHPAQAPGSGSGTGLTARYWTNADETGTPTLVRTDQAYSLGQRLDPPPGATAAGGWSASWTGTLTAPTTGVYAFSAAAGAGGGVRLTVAGHAVVDDWQGVQSRTDDGTVRLTAGQQVTVRLDLHATGSGSGTAAASGVLGWEPPGPDNPITRAVRLAAASDMAVVFAGSPEAEGADLTGIELPGLQNALIEAVAAANPHTVVVLNTGSAVAMPWADQVSAVLEAWYPGQEDGDATAALLFGTADPSGKLPVSFPRSLADVPAATPAQWPGTGGTVQYSEGQDVGYRWYDATGTAPLYPFGYGLSYTTFGFSDLRLGAASGRPGAPLTVTATVTNTGTRAGAEVAQLYLGFPASAGEPPRQLRGFAKVQLAPGQSRQVGFTLPADAFRVWSDAADGWRTPSGDYTLSVGDSSADLPLTAPYTITAP